MNKTFVSIIIPTFKDWRRLALCLRSLAVQSYDVNLFEIIVVNNHASDKIPENYFIPNNCRIVIEEKPGSYAARNTGVNLSTGSIIGFTDSDCIADKDWIKNAVAFFHNNPDCSRIAGKIRLFYKSEKLTKAELYEKIYAFNQDVYVEQDGTGVTANMFAYRDAFDTIGYFKDDLLSGGDYEWSIRARDAGFKIKYSEQTIVNHPARYQLTELIKKAKRVGGGQAGFEPAKASIGESIIKFVYDLRPPVKSIPLIVAKGKDLHFAQKCLIFYIRYYLSITTAREKLKVSLGKTAQRV
ncbi:glycosyltransferase [Pedobacter sp. HMF7647]|uniref:Glycosyltransferase n=1 Tax=Hufsiella arboris TaxID=2695275 RepID=A0A7K1Y9Q4_9SPHI|nr:glycosyltransferase family A protein [Hufsiella arboris]MXV51315.1 glycosyltransferase [Hufsiella arboris]